MKFFKKQDIPFPFAFPYDGSQDEFITGDLIPISKEEADEMRQGGRALTPLEKIAALEAENPITHRNLRELSLAVAQIIAQVAGVDPMSNPGIQKLKTIDTQIAALRAQL